MLVPMGAGTGWNMCLPVASRFGQDAWRTRGRSGVAECSRGHRAGASRGVASREPGTLSLGVRFARGVAPTKLRYPLGDNDQTARGMTRSSVDRTCKRRS